jgi:hypothetical protein
MLMAKTGRPLAKLVMLSILVGGEPYSIPRSGRQGNIVRFTVDTAEE